VSDVRAKPAPRRRRKTADLSEPGDSATTPHPAPRAMAVRPRSLGMEVGVIVLGVLLALGAQQAAQWLEWRAQAAEARQNLKRDEVRLVRWAAEREALSPCIDRRLKELTAVVGAAAATGRLPPLAASGMPTRRPWTVRSWETLKSGGLLSHMPKDEVRVISSLALYLDTVRPMRDREIVLWGQLRALGSAGRPFGDAEAAAMWAALSEARDRRLHAPEQHRRGHYRQRHGHAGPRRV
jgi:hypothetical protein